MYSLDELKPHLSRAFGWKKYCKRKAQAKSMLAALVIREQKSIATKAAGKVRTHHKEAQSPFPSNPSTDVDLLIKAIDDTLIHANKIL